MVQSTILAEGTTKATSTDIAVAAGATATVGLFSADEAGVPRGSRAYVYQDTPGSDIPVTNLDPAHASTQLYGPGTYRVTRPAGPGVGVFLEE